MRDVRNHAPEEVMGSRERQYGSVGVRLLLHPYVFSESIFPLLIEILSLETCLKSLYSRNMFQGSTYTPQIGNTDCEFVI